MGVIKERGGTGGNQENGGSIQTGVDTLGCKMKLEMKRKLEHEH